MVVVFQKVGYSFVSFRLLVDSPGLGYVELAQVVLEQESLVAEVDVEMPEPGVLEPEVPVPVPVEEVGVEPEAEADVEEAFERALLWPHDPFLSYLYCVAASAWNK